MAVPKVFGIGLPKTGTTTFHHAMQTLGLRSVHDPRRAEELLRHVRANRLPDWYDSIDSLSDGTMFRTAEHLLRLDPTARLVITHREHDDWINSYMIQTLHDRLLQRSNIHEFNFERHHREWVQAELVYERLRNNPRVLKVDFTQGAGWEELCPFLDLPIPEAPFPRSNTGLQKLREILAIMTDANASEAKRSL